MLVVLVDVVEIVALSRVLYLAKSNPPNKKNPPIIMKMKLHTTMPAHIFRMHKKMKLTIIATRAEQLIIIQVFFRSLTIY